jgi:hypothetical protein
MPGLQSSSEFGDIAPPRPKLHAKPGRLRIAQGHSTCLNVSQFKVYDQQKLAFLFFTGLLITTVHAGSSTPNASRQWNFQVDGACGLPVAL